MCQIAINIPNEVLYDIKMSTEEATSSIRKLVAMNFYSEHRVSLGYCAQIAGMNKADFIRFLGANNISIFHFDNEDEFLEEIENARPL